jgi:uncharacterized protein (DUF488 family)
MGKAECLLKLFTIGHGNQSLESLVELLKGHDIRCLLDVRTAPYSKYVPHFNKRYLEAELPSFALDYRYAGEHLGGRPKQPELYRQGTQINDQTDRDDYLKLVDYEAVMRQVWYHKALARLVELVVETGERVCIMCSESDPHDCHRHHLIARSLLDPSVRVSESVTAVHHILSDGGTEVVNAEVFTDLPRQLSLF